MSLSRRAAGKSSMVDSTCRRCPRLCPALGERTVCVPAQLGTCKALRGRGENPNQPRGQQRRSSRFGSLCFCVQREEEITAAFCVLHRVSLLQPSGVRAFSAGGPHR